MKAKNVLKKTGEMIKKNKNYIMYIGGLYLVINDCMRQGYEKGYEKGRERGIYITCSELKKFKPEIMTEWADYMKQKNN